MSCARRQGCSADIRAAAEVESHINAQPYLAVKRIQVPVKDKRRLREVLEEYEITTVINISRSRAPTVNDADYATRRAAVDFGIPLINNAKLAVLFTETLDKKFRQNPLPYVEGTNPPEVKSWREFVPHA